jgi:hypothetical protein
MATVILNPWFRQIRGKIGDLIFKQYGDRIVAACKPDMSGVQWSEAQLAQRERFRRAAKMGKHILADPLRHAEYAARARETGRPIFSLVLADCYVIMKEEEAERET